MTKPFAEIRFKGTEEEVNLQWLEKRREGIGGSDAAAILSLSKYATPLSVWLEKTGQVEPEDISDKPPVYWGKVLEDVVAKEYAKRHPEMKVRRLNAMLFSIEHPFMFASVDRVLTDAQGRKGILEIKTADKGLTKDWEEGIPLYYLPQPIHYLAVTGYEFYSVAVLIGGNNYKEFTYERDESDIETLVKAEKDFWNLVETNTMPDIVSADSGVLHEAYPDPTAEYLKALDSDIPEISQYEDICKQIDACKEKKDELAAKIKKRIGGNRGIVTTTRKVTWVRSESTRFATKDFKEKNPDEYIKYLKTYTRDGGLKVTEIKEK